MLTFSSGFATSSYGRATMGYHSIFDTKGKCRIVELSAIGSPQLAAFHHLPATSECRLSSREGEGKYIVERCGS